jgi:hypothetical protein
MQICAGPHRTTAEPVTYVSRNMFGGQRSSDPFDALGTPAGRQDAVSQPLAGTVHLCVKPDRNYGGRLCPALPLWLRTAPIWMRPGRDMRLSHPSPAGRAGFSGGPLEGLAGRAWSPCRTVVGGSCRAGPARLQGSCEQNCSGGFLPFSPRPKRALSAGFKTRGLYFVHCANFFTLNIPT